MAERSEETPVKKETPLPPYPGHEKFLFDAPLYTVYEIKDDDPCDIIDGTLRLDGRCPWCSTNRIFSGLSLVKTELHGATQTGHVYYNGLVSFQCAKDSNHRITIWPDINRMKIAKFGQYPSYADIATSADADLTKTLDKLDRAEYNKAIRLASHDAGIGAYAYLRRIFERLVYSRYEQHKADKGWKDEDFFKLRMNEKISFLKENLPPLLVNNSATYGILSDGLHNLTEQQCLAVFPIVRQGILLMLRQDKELQDRKKEEAEFTKAISTLNSTK